jgi:hypothetical protein
VEPYYQREGVLIYHADCRELTVADADTLIVDPPWDDPELLGDLAGLQAPSRLAFTGPRWMGATVSRFGAPAWLFTWDTRTSWQSGPRRPLQRTKHALWYGELDSYRRDAQLWGDPPPARDHPSTKQVPLDGRRLTDLWVESHRHLRTPGWLEAPAGEGLGQERLYGARRSDPVLKHAKPVDWLRCLIGNTDPDGGRIYDPCIGSGSSIAAAIALGRQIVAVDVGPSSMARPLSLTAQLVSAAAASPC